MNRSFQIEISEKITILENILFNIIVYMSTGFFILIIKVCAVQISGYILNKNFFDPFEKMKIFT